MPQEHLPGNVISPDTEQAILRQLDFEPQGPESYGQLPSGVSSAPEVLPPQPSVEFTLPSEPSAAEALDENITTPSAVLLPKTESISVDIPPHSDEIPTLGVIPGDTRRARRERGETTGRTEPEAFDRQKALDMLRGVNASNVIEGKDGKLYAQGEKGFASNEEVKSWINGYAERIEQLEDVREVTEALSTLTDIQTQVSQAIGKVTEKLKSLLDKGSQIDKDPDEKSFALRSKASGNAADSSESDAVERMDKLLADLDDDSTVLPNTADTSSDSGSGNNGDIGSGDGNGGEGASDDNAAGDDSDGEQGAKKSWKETLFGKNSILGGTARTVHDAVRDSWKIATTKIDRANYVGDEEGYRRARRERLAVAAGFVAFGGLAVAGIASAASPLLRTGGLLESFDAGNDQPDGNGENFSSLDSGDTEHEDDLGEGIDGHEAIGAPFHYDQASDPYFENYDQKIAANAYGTDLLVAQGIDPYDPNISDEIKADAMYTELKERWMTSPEQFTAAMADFGFEGMQVDANQINELADQMKADPALWQEKYESFIEQLDSATMRLGHTDAPHATLYQYSSDGVETTIHWQNDSQIGSPTLVFEQTDEQGNKHYMELKSSCGGQSVFEHPPQAVPPLPEKPPVPPTPHGEKPGIVTPDPNIDVTLEPEPEPEPTPTPDPDPTPEPEVGKDPTLAPPGAFEDELVEPTAPSEPRADEVPETYTPPAEPPAVIVEQQEVEQAQEQGQAVTPDTSQQGIEETRDAATLNPTTPPPDNQAYPVTDQVQQENQQLEDQEVEGASDETNPVQGTVGE